MSDHLERAQQRAARAAGSADAIAGLIAHMLAAPACDADFHTVARRGGESLREHLFVVQTPYGSRLVAQ